jgi:ankyrin repeat protein
MSELAGSPVSPLHKELFEAAENGDLEVLARLLDEDPERSQAVTAPYELTLLHLAASAGRLPAVELLLDRRLDVNARDKGDLSTESPDLVNSGWARAPTRGCAIAATTATHSGGPSFSTKA